MPCVAIRIIEPEKKVTRAPLIGCNMASMNKLVVGDDGASFCGKGNIKEELVGENLITVNLLQRGLISGYPAPRAAFVGRD
jgi:hypothetical protein